MESGHLKSMGLSIDALEMELQRSVRNEQRHWHENDAKLRAIEQRVATYEEFRGLVDGCELRPLKFKEVKTATKRYAGWAPALSSTSCVYTGQNNLPPTNDLPEQFDNIDSFIRCWNDLERRQSEAQLARLLAEQPELLQEVFASSAGLHILPRLLKSLLVASADTPDSVIHTLQAISSSKNFELTAMFMSDEEKTLIGDILETLKNTTGQQITDELRRLWLPT